MIKIFFVRLAKDKASLTVEEVFAEESGCSLKYYCREHTCFVFRESVGKPNRDCGVGFTPEEAAQSLCDGLAREAERLERRARELRALAALEIAS